MNIKYVMELNGAMLEGRRGSICVIKVYMDESGTHDGSPVVTVGAYLAKPKQWTEFAKHWKMAIKPVKCYHASEAASLNGEFEGWTDEQVGQLCAKALPVIVKNTAMGIAAGINMKDLMYGLEDRPDLKNLLGSPYIACLYWVMIEIMKEKERNNDRQDIAFVHEDNEYTGSALAVFRRVKELHNKLDCRMSFTFGAKKDYVPLQAADILAFEANKKIRNVGGIDRRSFAALQPYSGNFAIHYMNKEHMPWVITKLEDMLAFKNSISPS